MTGQEGLEQALQLLRYTDRAGHPDSRFRQDIAVTGLAAVNQVYADLWAVEQTAPFVPLANLSGAIALSPKGCEALPLGVAMWLAGGEGDDSQQAVMAAAYSQKRGQCPARLRRRQDVVPWGEGI